MGVIESFIESLGSTAYPGPTVSYTSHLEQQHLQPFFQWYPRQFDALSHDLDLQGRNSAIRTSTHQPLSPYSLDSFLSHLAWPNADPSLSSISLCSHPCPSKSYPSCTRTTSNPTNPPKPSAIPAEKVQDCRSKWHTLRRISVPRNCSRSETVLRGIS